MPTKLSRKFANSFHFLIILDDYSANLSNEAKMNFVSMNMARKKVACTKQKCNRFRRAWLMCVLCALRIRLWQNIEENESWSHRRSWPENVLFLSLRQCRIKILATSGWPKIGRIFVFSSNFVLHFIRHSKLLTVFFFGIVSKKMVLHFHKFFCWWSFSFRSFPTTMTPWCLCLCVLLAFFLYACSFSFSFVFSVLRVLGHI